MHSFADVAELYHSRGDEIVAITAEHTASQFDESGIPVLICAFNEEDDLPVTLAALSRSIEPVWPVVVDNCSTDRTAEFASTMGATVLEEKMPAKVFALAAGLRYIGLEQESPKVLFTDADTLMSKSWAGSLSDRLNDLGDFSAVAGVAVFHSLGERQTQKLANTVRTAANLGKFYIDAALGHYPTGRGPNMGFAFDAPDRVTEILEAFDFSRLVGNDTQLMDRMIESGAKTGRATGPSSQTITRGDRMPNLPTVLRVMANREYRKRFLYPEWHKRMADSEPALQA